MEQGEFRVLDLGDQRAELDQLDPLEVLDGKQDAVSGTSTRQNRLYDLGNAHHDFLPFVQVVDREPDPDPAEGDDPGARLNRPEADREYEFRCDAQYRDEGEERHQVVPLHIGHRPSEDNGRPVHHEEQEEEHHVGARGHRIEIEGQRDEHDDEARDGNRNVWSALSNMELPEGAG